MSLEILALSSTFATAETRGRKRLLAFEPILKRRRNEPDSDVYRRSGSDAGVDGPRQRAA
jgi:hypothetical protein